MSLNAILTIISFVLVIGITVALYITHKKTKKEMLESEKMTMDRLLEEVKFRINDLIKEDTFYGKNDTEWEAIWSRRKRIRDAITNCKDGNIRDKIIVQDIIKSIVQDILPNEESVAAVMDLNGEFLDPMVKFEIIMYYKKLELGTKAPDSLSEIIHQYNITRDRFDDMGRPLPYSFEIEDLELIYQEYIKEGVKTIPYLQQLEIISVLLFQKYQGFGCVDTINEMNIDGYNCGTSGSIMKQVNVAEKAPRSVWLYFEGKYVHMKFLTFYTMEELRRVVLLISRYNSPGQLTEAKGYSVTTMENKSRVLAIRPPAGEYWAVFVRKFTLSSQTLESLVNPDWKDLATGEKQLLTLPIDSGEAVHAMMWYPEECEVNHVDGTVTVYRKKYKNAFLPLNMIKYLIKGQVTTAFTGRQGSGKTTLMTGAISQVDPHFNIRVLELAPEMYLRELYPKLNILSVQETPTVSAAMLQDALKKSDAALSIVGEVASDVVAARMLQMAQVASIFTIFSHHANRAKDLIEAITNSVVAASGSGVSTEVMLPQVIDVIKMDIHLDYDVRGNRYVERITEIVRLDSQPYEEYDPRDPHSMNRITADYYKRKTDRKLFTTRDIIRFDRREFRYFTHNLPSDDIQRHILQRLSTDEERRAFAHFINDNWKAGA